jgi:hypothetical protein
MLIPSDALFNAGMASARSVIGAPLTVEAVTLTTHLSSRRDRRGAVS